MGRFVSSPSEREKRDRRDSRGDERERQERKRRNKNIPPIPLPVTKNFYLNLLRVIRVLCNPNCAFEYRVIFRFLEFLNCYILKIPLDVSIP